MREKTNLSLREISAPVEPRLLKVDHLISEQLVSDVPLIGQIGRHIIGSGGKRVRPILVLLCCGLIDYTHSDQHTLAALIEYIHTATLLHDDVIDGAKIRRGLIAAHLRWSTPAAVLAGDFLYTRAFQMMVELRRDSIMKIMAETTNRIAQGELLQLSQVGDLKIKTSSLEQMARYKTAELFGAACMSAGCLAQVSEEKQQALYQYGIELGLAYQLIDDALDYAKDGSITGKSNGTDLAEGKVTLPLLLTYSQADRSDQKRIRTALKRRDRTHFEAIRELVEESGALKSVLSMAEEAAEKASQQLNLFEVNCYHDALCGLTRFICARTR